MTETHVKICAKGGKERMSAQKLCKRERCYLCQTAPSSSRTRDPAIPSIKIHHSTTQTVRRPSIDTVRQRYEGIWGHTDLEEGCLDVEYALLLVTCGFRCRWVGTEFEFWAFRLRAFDFLSEHAVSFFCFLPLTLRSALRCGPDVRTP